MPSASRRRRCWSSTRERSPRPRAERSAGAPSATRTRRGASPRSPGGRHRAEPPERSPGPGRPSGRRKGPALSRLAVRPQAVQVVAPVVVEDAERLVAERLAVPLSERHPRPAFVFAEVEPDARVQPPLRITDTRPGDRRGLVERVDPHPRVEVPRNERELYLAADLRVRPHLRGPPR